jgi:stage II sporulation protein D
VVALSLMVPAVASAAAPARSAGTFAITGAGFGHGIGMSQYGALGFAEHGWSYQGILGHYYQGTTLATVPNSTVTVLIKQGAASFTGATSANGTPLEAAKRYGVLVAGAQLELISAGRRVGSFTPPLTVDGPSLSVIGRGDYAGSLEFFPSPRGSGVLTVNAVDLEDYVRGVVTEESPASWPAAALEAQAVAARSYVLAVAPAASEYQVYADTRSQVYGGITGESSAGDLAVADTAGQVVESGGQVVPTYFFSSSGGHTEDIQDVWLDSTPVPYLTGVSDPYDDASDDPYYRWRDTLSLATAARRLAGLYQGSFEGIKVLKHGTSPRIVTASVVGSRGASTVAGTTLQADLGTMSTWMAFTTVTAHGTVRPSAGSPDGTAAKPKAAGAGAGGSGPSTGGAGIGGAVRHRLAGAVGHVVSGSVFPVAPGARVTVQRRSTARADAAARWITVGSTQVGAGGAYTLAVPAAGVYRALYRGVAAPNVTLG